MLATIRRQLKDQPPYILSMSEPILEKLEKLWGDESSGDPS